MCLLLRAGAETAASNGNSAQRAPTDCICLAMLISLWTANPARDKIIDPVHIHTLHRIAAGNLAPSSSHFLPTQYDGQVWIALFPNFSSFALPFFLFQSFLSFVAMAKSFPNMTDWSETINVDLHTGYLLYHNID